MTDRFVKIFVMKIKSFIIIYEINIYVRVALKPNFYVYSFRVLLYFEYEFIASLTKHKNLNILTLLSSLYAMFKLSKTAVPLEEK